MKKAFALFVIFLNCFLIYSQDNSVNFSIKDVEEKEGEIIFKSDSFALKLEVCHPSIVRVLYTINNNFSKRKSLSVINHHPGKSDYKLNELKNAYKVKTKMLEVLVNKSDASLTFYDFEGKKILTEPEGGGKYINRTFTGSDDVFRIKQSFRSTDDEAIYGFGQFQDGVMNWKNIYVRLKQENVTAVMPVYYSNKGYGIFWHNYSFTEVNPEKKMLPMNAIGNILSTTFIPSTTGLHTFDIARNGINRLEFRIGDSLIYEHKTGVYAESAVCKLNMKKDKKYSIIFESFDKKINPPITAEYLIPADSENGEQGLKGEYFENSSLSGEPVLTRIDPKVDFNWGSSSFGEKWKNDNFSVRWTGKLISPISKKECVLSVTTDDGVRLYVDGKLVIDSWYERGPETDQHIMDIEAERKYDIRIEYYESGGGASAKFGWDMVKPGPEESELKDKVKVYYRTPAQSDIMSIRSDVADEIDYYFMYGPEPDSIVSHMRELTGRVPLYPKWAYGLFMSKMAWNSQDEIKDVVKTHREKNIPLDCIVQDMNYWELHPENKWGSHLFDSERYPDPEGMVDYFHQNNAKVMISIWPRFNVNTDTYQELEKNGYMLSLQKTSTEGNEGIEMESVTANAAYDAFSTGARQMYWDFINQRLFSKGFDAWWLDATEPEWGYDFSKARTSIGSGKRYLNAYSLMSMKGVYEGQLSEDSTKRPYLLTRSSFPGQQRYGVTTWSGDIGYDWDVFKKQISAGLNFSITGDPYYTHDIGGFIPGADVESEKYRELLYRWFQFGVFTPVFRVHGCRDTRLWATGPEMEAKLSEYTNFRYRLMPYIYSLGAMVTFNHYTIMRPLVMDFRMDENINLINDQYMFGPSLMVNPVTEYAVDSRKVYLPKWDGGWIDFWTGTHFEGGEYLNANTTNGTMPLYVKSGSIIPMGPYVQYATEKRHNALEIRIYEGADGEFILYEDENDGFDYLDGKYSKIKFIWNNDKRELTISEIDGNYRNMPIKRVFELTLVRKGVAVGIEPPKTTDFRIEYDGNKEVVIF